MTGKMDVALIFEPGKIPSLEFTRICTEELHFVTTNPELIADKTEITLAEAIATPLILPSNIHTIRQVIDLALARSGLTTQPIAQTESISVLSNAIDEGLAATILPQSAARAVRRRIPKAQSVRIRKPNMKINMSICVSSQLPLSEAASVVQTHLTQLAKELAAS